MAFKNGLITNNPYQNKTKQKNSALNIMFTPHLYKRDVQGSDGDG